MIKLLRPNCKPWCGYDSSPSVRTYKDLPGYNICSTYWLPGRTPYNGPVQIWDSVTCVSEKVPPNREIFEMKDKLANTYFVWRVGTGNPVYDHFNLNDAKIEATRLAKAFPGEKFIVCEAVASCEYPLPTVKWTEYERTDEIPF